MISTECRLWGDRLADGVEAKTALWRYHIKAMREHWKAADRHQKQAEKLQRQLAAVEAASRKRR